MKPTREELEGWTASGGNSATVWTDRARAARYALELEREVERLRGAIDRHGLGGQRHAPSPLLDDALWRRRFAEKALEGWLAGPCQGDVLDSYEDHESPEWHQHQAAVARTCLGYADALLAALREREGKP